MILTWTLMCHSTFPSVPVCLHTLRLPSVLKKVVCCRDVRRTGWWGSVTKVWHNASRKHGSQTVYWFMCCMPGGTDWLNPQLTINFVSIYSSVFSIARCRAEFPRTVRLPSSKCVPLIPEAGTAHEMVTCKQCVSFVNMWHGCSLLQYWQCLLAYPQRWECASSDIPFCEEHLHPTYPWTTCRQ